MEEGRRQHDVACAQPTAVGSSAQATLPMIHWYAEHDGPQSVNWDIVHPRPIPLPQAGGTIVASPLLALSKMEEVLGASSVSAAGKQFSTKAEIHAQWGPGPRRLHRCETISSSLRAHVLQPRPTCIPPEQHQVAQEDHGCYVVDVSELWRHRCCCKLRNLMLITAVAHCESGYQFTAGTFKVLVAGARKKRP